VLIARYTDAQVVGLALVVLALIIFVSWLVRRRVAVLQRLYIPTAVIGGFAMLILGPQVLGALTSSRGLFPVEIIDVWRTLPGLLINVVFGAIMIGKRLPKVGALWDLSAPHFILGSTFSFGQFALGGFAVALLLTPVFGLSPAAGGLLEMSFAGGHGTIAGMGEILVNVGAPEVVDIGLGLATISMVTGIVAGTMIVSWGMRSPKVQVLRQTPFAESEGTDLTSPHIAPVDEPDDEAVGVNATTAAFMYISVAIALAIVLLEALRWVANAFGSDVFDHFPLFPFTVIGGFVVQALLTRFKLEHTANKKAVDGISGFALDMLIVAAIGTMSLATIGSNIPAVVVFTVLGVGWSVFGMLVLGPRIHRRNWFEHSLADFGQSQGNVATGFVLADMADPKRQSASATAYGYKQLTYEPILGGGLLTALSVPIIMAVGSLPFAIASSVITLALITWGVRRRPRSAAA